MAAVVTTPQLEANYDKFIAELTAHPQVRRGNPVSRRGLPR
jgi:hypothetical protein